MFTLSEFMIVRDKCPEEMKALLEMLGIRFEGWDRITAYSQNLDGEITRKVCSLMHSRTLSEGYSELLDSIGAAFRAGNPDEMLASVVENSAEIVRAVSGQADKFTFSTLQEVSIKGFVEAVNALYREALDASEGGYRKLLDGYTHIMQKISALYNEAARLPEKAYLQGKSRAEARHINDLPKGRPVMIFAEHVQPKFTYAEAENLMRILEQLHAVRSRI
ncbi:MAG: hypothetical protein IJS39_10585 [Synergistaceae bacterium]|nr:hypothetical protein [Synergistaceae bacterium]